ncbi:MAG TPA: pyridoxamine 5'-phosphate oxidase family protein [Saprospiraceae bacterium]|nr:pyridoxamine 5'-phosphate oxidase family protein [Saprospiraceae bacterium]
MSLKSERSEIHRLPARGHYDRETIYGILDANFLCHVSFLMDRKPFIIPTAYGRDGDDIYLHGSAKSQMLNHLASGAEAAIAVTQIDGVVLARSLFHSSMNYHSVVVYGKGHEITDPDAKMEGLRIISERIWPGRWDEARIPDEGELSATKVIRIHITDGAAKIRTGPAKDNAEDYALDIWAGVVPVEMRYLIPVTDDKFDREMKIPPTVMRRITH